MKMIRLESKNTNQLTLSHPNIQNDLYLIHRPSYCNEIIIFLIFYMVNYIIDYALSQESVVIS